MDKLRFLVYDSGVGGLNVFARLFCAFPCCDFYYVSDSVNCPYGLKTEKELKSIAVEVLCRSCAGSYDGVILACNTLSTTVLSYLKRRLTRPVFGVLPPCALKGETLLLCTPRSAKSAYIKKLSLRYKVVEQDDLAKVVEDNIFDLDHVVPDLCAEGEFDNIVLGCTHYIYLSGRFMAAFPRAEIYDGTEGLLARLGRFIEKSEYSVTTFCTPPKVGLDNFIGKDKYRNYGVFCKYFPKLTQTFYKITDKS